MSDTEIKNEEFHPRSRNGYEDHHKGEKPVSPLDKTVAPEDGTSTVSLEESLRKPWRDRELKTSYKGR